MLRGVGQPLRLVPVVIREMLLMRVLLMTNMYPSPEEPGYGSFVLRQQTRLAEEHGIEFRLVATTRRGTGSANWAKYASLLWQTLVATVRGDFDLVHAHYLLPVAAFSLIPSAIRKKPLVITAHGTDIYTGRWRFWYPRIVRALRRSCRVIVVSRFLADELLDGFGAPDPDRIVIANMGVDTDVFTPGDTVAEKVARGLPSDVPHLLFVGNFVEQKGVTDLARALVLLADAGVEFRATLLGHGPDLAEVAGIVVPLGERVRLEHVVPHAELVPLFRSADVFVLPSRREGVGLLVCLEALSSGVPVVAGAAGGLPEIVRDDSNGLLVPPSDPQALADALESLLRDPERRARLAANARESALPYDERVQTAKVAEVYAVCAGGGGR